MDNGIPLCFDCHAAIGKYNKKHPLGNKYRYKELKTRREQIYEEYTKNLVPPIHFFLTQDRINKKQNQLTFVGFHLQHLGDSFPIRIKVEAKIILGDRDMGLTKDHTGYYTGQVKWNLNPRTLFWGGFSIPTKYCPPNSKEELIN